MELTNIKVTKMHGFINASMSLKKGVAIVVGVNGAGKTSLLNLTANMLRMNFADLFATQFATFSIKGKVSSGAFELLCAKSEDSFTIKFKHKSKLIETKHFAIAKLDEQVYQDRAAKYNYDRVMRRVYDDVAGSRIAKFLRDNARVTMVRLDRTLFAEESDGGIAIDGPHQPRRIRDVDDPVSRVDTVTRARYNEYRIEASRAHVDLTSQIVSLIFQLPSNLITGKASGNVRFSGAQLGALRDKLVKILNVGANPELGKKVAEYFDYAAQVRESASAPDGTSEGARKFVTQLMFETVEFPRLRGLSAAFEKYDKEIAKSFAQLEKFKSHLNEFLVDSNKEMFFSESEFSLRFRLAGSKDGVGRPVSELSSGEKQIVIMLTYLAFLAGEESLFIVDEPELSLHLAWQRKLVESLDALKPRSSQLILATHSPEIVGPFRSAVSRLEPGYEGG